MMAHINEFILLKEKGFIKGSKGKNELSGLTIIIVPKQFILEH